MSSIVELFDNQSSHTTLYVLSSSSNSTSVLSSGSILSPPTSTGLFPRHTFCTHQDESNRYIIRLPKPSYIDHRSSKQIANLQRKQCTWVRGAGCQRWQGEYVDTNLRSSSLGRATQPLFVLPVALFPPNWLGATGKKDVLTDRFGETDFVVLDQHLSRHPLTQ
jgi:hypothetical protein